MALLGLRKGDIHIAPHCPEWKVEAERVIVSILEHVGLSMKDIQHVGSTSIVGIPAKPILDFVIGVDDMSKRQELVTRLIEMGYDDRGLGPGSIGHLLVWEVSPLVRTQHLHIVEHDSEHWHHYTDFRDHMNCFEDDRLRLKKLKEAMIQMGVTREEYQSRKSALVEDVWQRIIAQ